MDTRPVKLPIQSRPPWSASAQMEAGAPATGTTAPPTTRWRPAADPANRDPIVLRERAEARLGPAQLHQPAPGLVEPRDAPAPRRREERAVVESQASHGLAGEGPLDDQRVSLEAHGGQAALGADPEALTVAEQRVDTGLGEAVERSPGRARGPVGAHQQEPASGAGEHRAAGERQARAHVAHVGEDVAGEAGGASATRISPATSRAFAAIPVRATGSTAAEHNAAIAARSGRAARSGLISVALQRHVDVGDALVQRLVDGDDVQLHARSGGERCPGRPPGAEPTGRERGERQHRPVLEPDLDAAQVGDAIRVLVEEVSEGPDALGRRERAPHLGVANHLRGADSTSPDVVRGTARTVTSTTGLRVSTT